MPGTTGWGQTATLADWLRAEPQRFEFPQAVRLLEQMAGPATVKLGARAGFAFPPSEVAALDGTSLTVSLLALGGALGPLPAAYTEERWREPAFADFLDIFHHRLLWLLYRIRCLYAPALAGEGNGHAIERALFAVAGLGQDGLRRRLAVADEALPLYAAWLGRDVRSAHGLEQVLSDFLGARVRVNQFQGRWATLGEARTRLGQRGHRLGTEAVLGSRAWDDHAAIELELGPLSGEMFLSLLPGGTRSAAVRDLVKLYLRDQQAFTFRLLLEQGAGKTAVLGQTRLGYTSLLGAARGQAAVQVTR